MLFPCSTVEVPRDEVVRWLPQQLMPQHTLPLAGVLDLLAITDEAAAVPRILRWLGSCIGASATQAVEYRSCGRALAVRRVVEAHDAASRDLPALLVDPDAARLGAWVAEAGTPCGGDRDAIVTVCSRTVSAPDRVSLLYRLTPSTAWLLHLVADGPGPAFDDERMARLVSCAFFAREVHRVLGPRAAAPAGRVDSAQVRLSLRAAALSGRERQICARIAGGHSAVSIAAELGIATSTVTTLRKRAYAKLGIHDRRDLCHLAA